VNAWRTIGHQLGHQRSDTRRPEWDQCRPGGSWTVSLFRLWVGCFYFCDHAKLHWLPFCREQPAECLFSGADDAASVRDRDRIPVLIIGFPHSRVSQQPVGARFLWLLCHTASDLSTERLVPLDTSKKQCPESLRGLMKKAGLADWRTSRRSSLRI
jgi:hypothetical protein